MTFSDAIPTSLSGRALQFIACCPACGTDATWTATASTTAVDCDCAPRTSGPTDAAAGSAFQKGNIGGAGAGGAA